MDPRRVTARAHQKTGRRGAGFPPVYGIAGQTGVNMRVNSQIGAFSIVPEWVLMRGLSPTALKLYVVLARFADYQTGRAFPSRETLADRMGCSEKTVDRAVRELEREECIRAWLPKRYASKQYQVFQVDPRGGGMPIDETPMSDDETYMSGEGTDLSAREDTDVHLTITNEREPINENHITKPAKLISADDYQPSEDVLAKLGQDFPGVRLDTELEKFRDHHMAAGSKFKDWDRAFRKWIRQASEWSPTARAARVQLEEEAKWAKLMEEKGME